MRPRWATKRLPEHYDEIASDTSEIRHLFATKAVSVVHCTLAPRATSVAMRHISIEEIWYFIAGQGEVWRKDVDDTEEEVVTVFPGICLTIPTNIDFQFRNTGEDPLRFLCVTTPPWPGEHASIKVESHYW